MSGDITHEGAMVTDIVRLTRSADGNPRWAITFVTMEADVITAKTKVNAAVGHYVGEHLLERFVTITRTRSGGIVGISRED